MWIVAMSLTNLFRKPVVETTFDSNRAEGDPKYYTVPSIGLHSPPATRVARSRLIISSPNLTT